ncbi:MAG: sortase [Bacilli bacterium]
MINLKKSKIKIALGYLMLILGIGILVYPLILNRVVEYQDNKKIKQYFNQENLNSETIIYKENEEILKEDLYIGILEIPSIDLKKGFYEINNVNNNVDKNIEILNGSDMPNIVNGTFILAGHSGSSIYSYFRNLNKLELNNKIYVYYNGYKYSYEVTNIYDIEKTGKIKIEKEPNMTALVLITCRHNTNKQIVIIADLLNEEKY